MDIELPLNFRHRGDIVRAFEHLAGMMREDAPAGADPIARMRDAIEHYGEPDPHLLADDVTSIPASCDGVAAEWLLPAGWEGGPDARLVYLHGGSWVGGGLNSHRHLASSLARHIGFPVLLVDYALAPEHPFPAGLEDCAKSVAWARQNGPNSNDRTRHLCLAGDSAGGNLAAATIIKAILDEGDVPQRLLLLSAALELTADTGRRAIPDPLNDYQRQVTQMQAIQALYLQNRGHTDDPLVSPLRATDEVLARFPATLLQVSSLEFLRWDAEQFAHRLAACHVRSKLSIWPGLPHVWQIFPGLPETIEALRECAAFLASRETASSGAPGSRS